MAFGRLERSTGPRPFSDINVTPLVDVMLVLVVIFIITAPLLASSIRLDLPKTPAAQPADAPKFITLVINREGQAFVNDQPVDTAGLASALARAAKDSADTEVQLRADAAVAYGRVVEIIGAAHQAGLHRVAFVAEPAGAASGAR